MPVESTDPYLYYHQLWLLLKEPTSVGGQGGDVGAGASAGEVTLVLKQIGKDVCSVERSNGEVEKQAGVEKPD